MKRKPTYSTVITVKIDGDNVSETSRRRINHDRRSEQQWLIDHIHWALRHGHGVQICPET